MVESVRTGTEVSNPPLPLTLLDLQRLMARQHGIDGQTTLAITQSLRDNWKAITYNRSDCPYLSDDQYAESPHCLTHCSARAAGITCRWTRHANLPLSTLQRWGHIPLSYPRRRSPI